MEKYQEWQLASRLPYFVIGCELEADAQKIMGVLPKRFARFGLRIHPTKTTLIGFRKPKARPVRMGTAHSNFSASPITGHEHVGGFGSSNAEQPGNGSGGPRRRCGNGVATTVMRLCNTSIGCCA
jgi:hypothetical protein